MKSTVKDDATLTGAQLLWRPRNLVVILVFYGVLVLLRTCLISVIRINASTVCNFSFHCWAIERLYHTRAALSFKDR
jgi:hypothetical protein